MQNVENEKPPLRKKRLSIQGKVIRVTESNGLILKGELEEELEQVLPALINKGWCVLVRNGFVALTGFTKQKDTTNDSSDKDILIPRNENIVSIAKIRLVNNEHSESFERWEVKTLWTVKRNIFSDIQSAWSVFLEVERRWDPGTILWSHIDKYERFEHY